MLQPFYQDESATFHAGDCRAVVPAMAENLFDSCVTDPPYELGFMGKGWDKSGVAYDVDTWRAVYRVLKPGAYLLAFGGSRTYHRLACAIEDAGFEIRDQIQWIYGSGFPKSLDVSKAIDREAGVKREVIGFHPNPAGNKAGGNSLNMSAEGMPETATITVAATNEARQWNGFGTALKPAHEPIVMARKPLEKGLTVAQNVLKWGTGGINIDGCRVETGERPHRECRNDKALDGDVYGSGINGSRSLGTFTTGRFPANVIHDGSDEVLAGFPSARSAGDYPSDSVGTGNGVTYLPTKPQGSLYADEGSAARFFYCAKASGNDRDSGLDHLPVVKCGLMQDDAYEWKGDENHAPHNTSRRNHHPTVKPTDLMQYLCRLVTPPGGLILDPFLGSGSTAKAALIERFKIVGVELSAEYLEIARARLNELQVGLF